MRITGQMLHACGPVQDAVDRCMFATGCSQPRMWNSDTTKRFPPEGFCEDFDSTPSQNISTVSDVGQINELMGASHLGYT